MLVAADNNNIYKTPVNENIREWQKSHAAILCRKYDNEN
jgi:hypothetical protein